MPVPDNLARLVTPPTAAERFRAEAIEILQDALAQAQAGQVTSVIVVLTHSDGNWSHKQSGTKKIAEAIGHLEVLKHAWIEAYQRDST